MSGKKRGRPEGSIQTPHSLLKADLREQVAMNKRLRALLGQAVAKLEKALEEKGDDPQLCLKIVETLGAGLSNQGKALDSTAKHVLTGEEAGSGGEDVDILEILKKKD